MTSSTLVCKRCVLDGSILMVHVRSLTYALAFAMLAFGLLAVAANATAPLYDAAATAASDAGRTDDLEAPPMSSGAAPTPCPSTVPLALDHKLDPEDVRTGPMRPSLSADGRPIALPGLEPALEVPDLCPLMDTIDELTDRVDPATGTLTRVAEDVVGLADEVDPLALLRCDPEDPRGVDTGPVAVTFTCEGRPLLEVVMEEVEKVVAQVEEVTPRPEQPEQDMVSGGPETTDRAGEDRSKALHPTAERADLTEDVPDPGATDGPAEAAQEFLRSV